MLKEKRKHELNFTQIDVSFFNILTVQAVIYEKKHTESLWLVPAVQPDARLTLCSCSVIRLQLVFIKAVVSYFWWFSGACHQLCHSEINYNMPLQWKNKTFFQLVCCRLRLKASSLTVSRGRLRMLRWMEFVEDAAHIGGCVPVCLCRFPQRQNQSFRAMLRPSPQESCLRSQDSHSWPPTATYRSR